MIYFLQFFFFLGFSIQISFYLLLTTVGFQQKPRVTNITWTCQTNSEPHGSLPSSRRPVARRSLVAARRSPLALSLGSFALSGQTVSCEPHDFQPIARRTFSVHGSILLLPSPFVSRLLVTSQGTGRFSTPVGCNSEPPGPQL